MSILQPAMMTCPACDETFEASVAHSVSADRRPDLRAAILDRSFQLVQCSSCQANIRIPPEMTYIDVERDQWILTQPADKLPDWSELERRALKIYDKSFGAKSPPAVRVLGANLQVRITFGWPALREKLLCREWLLDDVKLELMKALLIRNETKLPLSDETELRLVDRANDTLIFVWIRSVDEGMLQQLSVPTELYQLIQDDPRDWELLTEQIASGPFVDVHRCLIPS